MSAVKSYFAEGGCTCEQVRYQLLTSPMFVHCCHCRWCQRETGTAFALNALIEADRVKLTKGEPQGLNIPSNSGKGQKIYRCPTCQIALWSNYGGAGDQIHFIRVGTLDAPDLLPPDIHIFTTSKQPWVKLDQETPAVDNYYRSKVYWPDDSLQRKKMLGQKSA